MTAEIIYYSWPINEIDPRLDLLQLLLASSERRYTCVYSTILFWEVNWEQVHSLQVASFVRSEQIFLEIKSTSLHAKFDAPNYSNV